MKFSNADGFAPASGCHDMRPRHFTHVPGELGEKKIAASFTHDDERESIAFASAAVRKANQMLLVTMMA